MKRDLERSTFPASMRLASGRGASSRARSPSVSRLRARPRRFGRASQRSRCRGARRLPRCSPPGRAVAGRDPRGRRRGACAAGAVLAPGAGRLLVASDTGVWVVQQDGSRRLLGEYREASWSPFGRFLVATQVRTSSRRSNPTATSAGRYLGRVSRRRTLGRDGDRHEDCVHRAAGMSARRRSASCSDDRLPSPSCAWLRLPGSLATYAVAASHTSYAPAAVCPGERGPMVLPFGRGPHIRSGPAGMVGGRATSASPSRRPRFVSTTHVAGSSRLATGGFVPPRFDPRSSKVSEVAAIRMGGVRASYVAGRTGFSSAAPASFGTSPGHPMVVDPLQLAHCRPVGVRTAGRTEADRAVADIARPVRLGGVSRIEGWCCAP